MLLTIKKLWAKLTNRVYVCVVDHDGCAFYRYARKHEDGFLWCLRFQYINEGYVELYENGTARYPQYKYLQPIKWFKP